MAIFDAMPAIPEINYLPFDHPPIMIRIEDMRMAPDLRVGDYVMVSPIDHFQYDSLYVVSELDVQSVWQCQSIGGGQISMKTRDGRTVPRVVSREEFRKIVFGLVAMTCRVLDHRIFGPTRH